jgi:Ni/Co efflux regulator RcnB
MKRILIFGLMSWLAAGAAFQVLAEPSGPADKRPPGISKPVGPPSHGPGRPGGGPPPRPTPSKPGGRPPSTRPPGGHHRPPPKPGHHRPSPAPGHRPPAPGHRPPNRPIYGWNHHRLRLGQFRYPAGYAYRRWSVGQSLPQLLFSAAYYFTDYAALGIDPPPYGYQWVRYGPDVVLVNIRTGEILDVINGAFY